MILVTMIIMTTIMRNKITKITTTTRIPPEAKAFQTFLSQKALQKPLNKDVSLNKICLNQFNPEVFKISPNQEPSLNLLNQGIQSQPYTEAFQSHLNQQVLWMVLGKMSSVKPQSQGVTKSVHREAKCQHLWVPLQQSWRCNMTRSSLLLLTFPS